MFDNSIQAIQSGIKQGVMPGAVFGVASLAHSSREDRIFAVGNRRLIPSSQPMAVDSVFDLASVSKVVATATMAATLVDRGFLKWNTPVSAVLPTFRWPDITLAHLLSHTSGFADWKPFWQSMREGFDADQLARMDIVSRQAKMRDLVFDVSPEVAPEVRMVYSDIGFLLAGFMIEEVVQKPLDQAVQELLWTPMGISVGRSGLHYRRVKTGVQLGRDEQVVATENCPWRGGVLQGQVHDDNTWTMGGYAGHAGVFGTAQDLLLFMRRLAGGWLKSDTLRAIWTPVSKPQNCERTLGWDTPSGETPCIGQFFSRRSVGHLGFTGTSLWLDLDRSVVVTLLTNRVHPTRENTKIKLFRAEFHDAVFLDLFGR